MKRIVVISLFSIFLCLVLGLGYMWSQRAHLASIYFTHLMGVPVEVQKINISSGRVITMSGFKILSSKGSVFPQSLIIKELQLQVDPKSLFEKVARIIEVRGDHIVISLEIYNVKGDFNNWTRLFRSFPISDDTKESLEEFDEGEVANSVASYIRKSGWVIDHLILQDIECEVLDKSSRKELISVIKIPEMQLVHLGAHEPLELNHVLRLMVDPLLMYVSKYSHLSQVYAHIPDLPPKLVQEIYPQVENTFLRLQSHQLDLQRKFYLADQYLEEEQGRLENRYLHMQEIIKGYFAEDGMINSVE